MKVLDIFPATASDIRCDGYIPVLARTLGVVDFPLTHWRTGDTKSLLDFGIDPVTGIICKVTVTMLCGCEVKPLQQQADFPECTNGVPSVLVEDWNQKASLHSEQPVNAALLGNRLVVRFGSHTGDVASAIRNGRVVFQIDQSRTISGIEIHDLSAKELEEFRYAVGITA